MTDFQKLNSSQMASEELFYKLLAATPARQLKFKCDFEEDWDPIFGANLNMESFLRELLDAADEPIVWFMDEVDKLFLAPFASDFFGLARCWPVSLFSVAARWIHLLQASTISAAYWQRPTVMMVPLTTISSAFWYLYPDCQP
jgi:hypothetical protein